MGKTHVRLAAIAILAFALMASACFSIRVLAIVGDKVLQPGGLTEFRVELFPLSTEDHATAYVALLVGTQDLDTQGFTHFDLNGNYGGPFFTTGDTSLQDYLLADNGVCSANGISAFDVDAASFDEWMLVRTTVEVDSSSGGGFAARFKTKIVIGRPPTGTADTTEGELVVFSVAWNDDGDFTEEASEIVCTSMLMTTVPFKAP